MASNVAVGISIPRADALGKVTGAAEYTADVHVPGALWAKALRSPHRSGHLRVRSSNKMEGCRLPSPA